MRHIRSARFSRVKPAGSFRVLHPSSRRVTGHANSLREARTDAAFWSKQSPDLVEIQELFPSGKWVTVETVRRNVPKARHAHTTMKSGSPSADESYTAKQRAAQAEIKLDAIPNSEWSRNRVIAILDKVDTDALREIERSHYLGGRIFTAGRQVAQWAREVLDERGGRSEHAKTKAKSVECLTTASIRLSGAPAAMQTREFKHRSEAETWLDTQRKIAEQRGWHGYKFELAEKCEVTRKRR